MNRPKKAARTRPMFREPQGHFFEQSYEEERAAKANQPVECLGMTFENDAARRNYFLDKLREKLRDAEFRKIEGFPIGGDEDILRLSDPPYYTACPNPFLADFVRCYGKPYLPTPRLRQAGLPAEASPQAGLPAEASAQAGMPAEASAKAGDANEPYHRTPFAVDVSEGKTDALYKAHSYHTKVPPKAIMRAILHYTEPGDLVLDGFAGSGMTGVAAQLCGHPDPEFKATVEAEWKAAGVAPPTWGVRRAVLSELSPAATFIAANYNLPFDVDAFARAAQRILAEVDAELGWMYETLHTDLPAEALAKAGGKAKGRINYTVWSEVFTCPECSREVVFLTEALDQKTKRVRQEFPCPHCSARLTKDNLVRTFETLPDPATGAPWKRIKLRPVLINYSMGKAVHEKAPDEADLAQLARIARLPLPSEVPTTAFPFEDMWEAPRLRARGIAHVHHLFLSRQAHALALLWRKTLLYPDARLRNALLFFVEQAIWGMSILNRYKTIMHGKTTSSNVNQYLPGVYYVPSQHSEVSPWYSLENRLRRLRDSAFAPHPGMRSHAAITTGAAQCLSMPENCVDYVFTDPPFGDNYPYAELNFVVESWHRVRTDPGPEAIVDRAKENRSTQKGITEYQRLMERCFREFSRVLKPGRWMTLVFSNSKSAVWHAIQEGLSAAGFVIGDVRTLDKQQRSFKQVTSSAPQQDLVISAYKPNGGLEARFRLAAGTEPGAWDFVRTHLGQLPVFVSKDGRAEAIAERQAYLLFDRMVAFHVLRGVTVPLSAAEFYAGLEQRFIPRDGMYFLPEQAAEYDRKRMTVQDVLQLELAVSDEASAIEWVRRELSAKPQTLQELTPKFMKEAQRAWAKHEKPLELASLLHDSFLCYDGDGEVPSQIHSYLSTNFKELRNRPKDDPALRAKAKHRWYVPDPNKAQDLEKLRERALLKEFWEYLPPGYQPAAPEGPQAALPGPLKPPPIAKGKRIKVLRTEAVRAGFAYCWKTRDYRTIIAVAGRLPEDVLQEDQKLLMWYDQAVTRVGAG
jgi:DNA-directed RNA polymerase subunit RPC12/RpoP